jgi:hypothetical protein
MARGAIISIRAWGPSDEKQLARDLKGADRELKNRINRTMRLAQKLIEEKVRSAAPEDTGLLKRGVWSRISFQRRGIVQVRIGASVRRRGYDYTDVTRFGHRGRRVYPKRARNLRVHYQGHMKGYIWRPSVRGHHPRRDWVETAMPDVRRTLKRAGDRLDTDITAVYAQRRVRVNP